MALSIVDKSPASAGATRNRAASQSAAIVEARVFTPGMVVDSASDVITLMHAQIKPAPEMGSTLDTDYLIGLTDKIAA